MTWRSPASWAGLLRQGLSSQPAELRPASLLAELRRRITSPSPVHHGHDGDGGAEEPLWLAHNLRAGPAASPAPQLLREALARVGHLAELPSRLGIAELQDIEKQLDGTGRAVEQARAVVANLLTAHRAAAFPQQDDAGGAEHRRLRACATSRLDRG